MSDLERLLTEALRESGESYEPSDQAEARRRFLERARRRRWYGFAEVAAVAGVGIAAFLFFTYNSGTEEKVRPEEEVAAGTPEIVATIEVGGDPVSIDSVTSSEVWVTGGDGLVAIDPGTNEPSNSLTLEDGPGDEVAVGDGHVWVSQTDGSISEVDPETGASLDEFGISNPTGASVYFDLAADGDSLWAVDGLGGSLYRIGPSPRERVFKDFTWSDVAVQDGRVWLLDQSRGRVFNPQPPPGDDSNLFTITPGTDSDLAAGMGYVWVSSGDGTLLRLSPGGGGSAELPLGDSYMDLTVDEKSVWALVNVDDEHKELFEINPATMEVIGEPLAITGDANDVVAEAGSVWVADGRGEVLRIEPSRNADEAPPPAEDEDQSIVGPSPAPLTDQQILFVYSSGGDIYGETLHGEVVLLNPPSGDIEQHPSFAPDGQSIVYERIDMEIPAEDRKPFVIQLDLATGEEKAIGDGAWPALAPDGRLATVQADETAEGLRSAIVISESPDEPGTATEVGTAELPEISHLSWSPDGGRLFWQASGEGTIVKEAEVDGKKVTPTFTLVPTGDTGLVESSDFQPGSNLLSPHATEDGVLALRLCCRDTEGDPFENMYAGIVQQQIEGVAYEDTQLLELPYMEPGFDVDMMSTGTLAIDGLAPPESRWTTDARSPSYLLSDGRSLWLVSPNGDATAIGGEDDVIEGHEGETDFRGFAVHPSLLD